MADAGREVTLEPAAPAALVCQPGALRRALVNLLDNAIKYGGSALVTIRDDGHNFTVKIADAGPGIPKPELTRVFEPFYRIEQSRSPETGGSGLGLTIALGVVQAHGGTIRLANRAEGGLCVCVVLPRGPQ
ncbi:sensor histidine kinase [Acidiphilium acidophilum]|uniref:sensor histidine kinase n=1 Tax=Acidiphilium acidophilum TaxID=76588 RepID=UPI002E8E6197|nr:sensor histidine kinase [Acidiphilium acidophilum]